MFWHFKGIRLKSESEMGVVFMNISKNARWVYLLLVIFLARQNYSAAGVHTSLVGYTELRADLPGGRHANVRTMRAKVIHTDGSAGREIAPGLVENENTWTQFAGWSPDGVGNSKPGLARPRKRRMGGTK